MGFGTQQPGVQSQDQGNWKVPESWLLSSFLVSLEQDTHVDWVTQRCSLITGWPWDLKNDHIEHAHDYLGIVSALLVIITRTLQLESTYTHKYTNHKKQKQSYVTLFAHKFHLHRCTGFTCLYQGRSMSFPTLLIQYNHCLEGTVTFMA